MGAQIAGTVALVSSGLMVRASGCALDQLNPASRSHGIGLLIRHKIDARPSPPSRYSRPAVAARVTAASAATCRRWRRMRQQYVRVEAACIASAVRHSRRSMRGRRLLQTMGIRVVRGRASIGEARRAESVVVVDELFASRFFPGQNPIGEHIASNRPPARVGETPTLEWLTIIGVVSHTPTRALAETQPIPQIYMPMSIAGGPDIPRADLIGPDVASMSYVVRSATAVSGLLPSVRRAIDSIDPNLALAQVGTLRDTLDHASAQMAFTMVLLGIAASVALMLGVIGIYGVMSYIVSQRTGEIGVRLALGADPGSVARMIVRQGGFVALAGIGVGLAAALAGGRLIESLLYGVGPRDPGVFGATTLAVLVVALLACWLPAPCGVGRSWSRSACSSVPTSSRCKRGRVRPSIRPVAANRSALSSTSAVVGFAHQHPPSGREFLGQFDLVRLNRIHAVEGVPRAGGARTADAQDRRARAGDANTLVPFDE